MSATSSAEQQRILQLARAGDPATLAALLNHRLRPRGATASVAWQGGELRVTLVGQPAPDPETTVALIEQAIAKLNIPTLTALTIAGCTPQQTRPVWQRRRQFGSDSLAAELLAWIDAGASTPAPALPAAAAAIAPRASEGPTIGTVADERKFLRFQLHLDNNLLIAVDYIQEILRLAIAQILPVPDMPEAVLGIYNWRGEMLWLVDLNALLGLTPIWALADEALASLNAIVLRVEERNLGLVVQQVDGIESYAPQALQVSKGLFPANLAPFVEGYLREGGSIALDAQAIARTPHLQGTVASP